MTATKEPVEMAWIVMRRMRDLVDSKMEVNLFSCQMRATAIEKSTATAKQKEIVVTIVTSPDLNSGWMAIAIPAIMQNDDCITTSIIRNPHINFEPEIERTLYTRKDRSSVALMAEANVLMGAVQKL